MLQLHLAYVTMGRTTLIFLRSVLHVILLVLFARQAYLILAQHVVLSTIC